MNVLVVLGSAFAAFCVWLMVRVVNRREPRAKWTLAAAVGVPVLYVASFGPACWMASQSYSFGPPPRTLILYWPLGKFADENQSAPARALRWWMSLGIPEHQFTFVPTSASTWTKLKR